RRKHVERADEADVGVAGKEYAHGVGIAGDMHVLDLQIAQPAFLLRHEIRQRERRDRPGEDHLDLAGMRGGRVEGEQRRGDANAHAKAWDAKTWAECTQSNRNMTDYDSPPGRQAIIGSEKWAFRPRHANYFSDAATSRPICGRGAVQRPSARLFWS